MSTFSNVASLKDSANHYHGLGIAVVPFLITQKADGTFDKKPLVQWGKWQTEPQTDAEFEALNWNEANGIGVVLGTKATNGSYLAFVDYDVKGKATEESKAAGAAILKDLPQATLIDETANKGLHYAYWSAKKVLTDSTFHDTAGVELLGDRKLCVISPSLGYRNIGSDIIAEVQDFEKLFYEILAKHGFRKEAEEETSNDNNDNATFSLARIVDLNKLEKTGTDDYQGCHPFHGSTTGKNFHVNLRLNAWSCLRHGTGGGPLQFLAMQEGIITCEKCQKGALRGKKFLEVVEIAKSRGLLPKDAFQEETKEKESHADKLVKLSLSQKAELFIDEYKAPFISYSEPLRNCAINGSSGTFSAEQKNTEKIEEVEKFSKEAKIAQSRKVICSLKSKNFKVWLANLFWNSEEKAVGNEALSSAINVLTGKALSEGKMYKLYNRVAPAEDGGIFLDMTDDSWRVIKITQESWEIIQNPPILFRRYNHQLPLVTPVKVTLEEARKGIQLLFKYINLKKDDEDNKLMFLCTLISYYFPNIPHPAIIAFGPQGSAKTWLLRIIRRVVDPSALEVLSFPRDEGELIQQLSHHWCTFYDNITTLSTWASNTLCRAVTGGGNSKRELYSDDDDTIYTFKRCIALNGINIAARNGDLFERSNLIELERISDKDRKTERELNDAFEKDNPIILGSILTILSETVKISKNRVKIDTPRMADFDEIACAISVALGKTSEDFQKIYNKKIAQQNEETINANPVALAFFNFCQKHFQKDANGKPAHESWIGTPTELYQQVLAFAQDTKYFPSSTQPFIRKINESAVSLQALGYEVIKKDGTPRQIIIRLNTQTQLSLQSLIQPTCMPTMTNPPSPEPEQAKANGNPEFKYKEDTSGDCDTCGNPSAVVVETTLGGKFLKLKKCAKCFNSFQLDRPTAVFVNLDEAKDAPEQVQTKKLVVTRTKNAEKCGKCASLGSEWECQFFINGVLERKAEYYCQTCTKAVMERSRKEGYEVEMPLPKEPEPEGEFY